MTYSEVVVNRKLLPFSIGRGLFLTKVEAVFTFVKWDCKCYKMGPMRLSGWDMGHIKKGITWYRGFGPPAKHKSACGGPGDQPKSSNKMFSGSTPRLSSIFRTAAFIMGGPQR